MSIEKRDFLGRPAANTVISIEATNTTTSKILKPRNQESWGGWRGASLTDSFGNEYKLESIAPRYRGNEAKGIRPGQVITFKVRFGDTPLENAKFVRLAVEPATFGQQAETVFELPSEAFFGSVK